MRYGYASAVDHSPWPYRLQAGSVRTRLRTSALVAAGALTTGALGIVMTLVTSDAARLPFWLRPYHRWGWWAILVLLLSAAVLAVWQHQQQRAAGMPEQPPPSPLDRLHLTRHPSPLVSNLPARNPTFTGRADLLDQLHRRLDPGKPAALVQAQAIHGLGGIGKTQLALEYAHRHHAEYDLIWWLAAEQPTAIPGQLVALARRLALPDYPEQAETVQALWDALRQRDRWLLIFDNAEDPADLRAWWPPDSGRVLVTSRHPAWTSLARTVQIDVPPRAEAVAFLRHRLGCDDSDFDQLAAALGDLPLALEQAAAYLDETTTSPSEYLALLDTHGSRLFTLGRPTTTEQTITTTWTVSLQRLRAQMPAAEDLLTLCAFLAPDEIPRTLLIEHPDQLPDRLAAAVQDPLAYQQGIGTLRRYALVSTTGGELRMHRLVGAVTRHALTPTEQERWAVVALRLVLDGFPENAQDANTWSITARLLPHALTVTHHPTVHSSDPPATVMLLNRVTDYLSGRAEHREARTLLELAVSTAESHLGPDHVLTAESLNNLGTGLHTQGDLAGARSLHERALAIRETRLGPDHLDTANSLNNLATVLRAQGDLAGARPLLERALTIREARLGPGHPYTAGTLNNLGLVLRGQGDLAGARALHERALAINQARLGPDHPYTAVSLNLLGLVLRDQGDLAGARPLHERALAINQARLDPDHPDTARSLTDLAEVLRGQGDLAGARRLLERAVAIWEARLGPHHLGTAGSLNNLANVVREQGDLDRARALLERALAIREARLDADHPYVAGSLNALGLILAAEGDLDGARVQLERALAIREARLGPDHTYTAHTLMRLATVLRRQGDLDGARALLERVVVIYETRLGDSHPDTVQSRKLLATVVARRNRRRPF
jgi:tetratricopeptide (TPR) repeat protein